MQYGSTVLFVDDVPATMDFYRRAFGFDLRFFDAEYEFGELLAGGAILGFASHRCGDRMMPGRYRRSEGGGPAGVEIAFYTSDVQTAFLRAVEAGAETVTHPTAMPWGQTVAYVRAIEGTIVGFCTPLESA